MPNKAIVHGKVMAQAVYTAAILDTAAQTQGKVQPHQLDLTVTTKPDNQHTYHQTSQSKIEKP